MLQTVHLDYSFSLTFRSVHTPKYHAKIRKSVTLQVLLCRQFVPHVPSTYVEWGICPITFYGGFVHAVDDS